ncbi:MAG: sensor histidine kinase [Chitinophagaceae bacterium]|nr:MAG: sensor histidine kinase [Chitinophagaceae bacterium]
MPPVLAPTPLNEIDRVLNLYEFDLDYANLEDTFKDLTYLAAKVSGTEISLINLIDTYTQWSISKSGLDIDQMAREDSVCQYTILENDHFEVENLAEDERFQHKDYVANPHNLRYYFGIPLKTSTGHHIGALCVLDTKNKKLSPEKIELLKIIANEIMTRLNTLKMVQDLKNKLSTEKSNTKKASHDIRGPLAGIIGVTQIIKDQLEENNLDQVLEMLNLISRSGKSLLDLTDEILSAEKASVSDSKVGEFNLTIFKDKLLKLYLPQALNKEITFDVNINPANASIRFSKNKLLQIVGNLVSNAIKFTAANGKVIAELDLQGDNVNNNLKISVTDTGVGLSKESIVNILNASHSTTPGTAGEKGYGFGLSMVKHLVDSLHGKMSIDSTEGKGARFEITLPLN